MAAIQYTTLRSSKLRPDDYGERNWLMYHDWSVNSRCSRTIIGAIRVKVDAVVAEGTTNDTLGDAQYTSTRIKSSLSSF